MESTPASTIGRAGGPVVPSDTASVALRPLAGHAVRLDPDGFLGRWQGLNARETLPHCIASLERTGAVDNLRRVARGNHQKDAGQNSAGREYAGREYAGREYAGREYAGRWFADSDVYKTLEAAAWLLGDAPGAEQPLREFVDGVADVLAEAQDEDGYLNSWFQLVDPPSRWLDFKVGHELYCAGHLLQAAVAAARGGLCPRLVEVATRLADLLTARFGGDGRLAICGHPEIETALVELFRTTGNRAYLDLAAGMVELRGRGWLARTSVEGGLGSSSFGPAYYQDHVPVRTAGTATGHAVRQLYLEAGVVDVAVETGDRELLAASERIWDDLFATKTYLTGAHGSRHRDESIGDSFELPPDRAYAETCAAIASFQWNWRLLLATGRARYADEMERVLYNAIAVATSVDGRNFFYSNPLQLRGDHDGTDEDAPARRLPWYGCPCCPPNLARLIASLHHYLATAGGTGIQLHLYAGATITAQVGGAPVELEVATEYPWRGRVAVTVARSPAPGAWELALRVPGWAPGHTVRVDGEPVDVAPRDGYLRLNRAWRPGTVIVLELPMPPRVVWPHPGVDAVRGCVALTRGPLVYCLEQADLPDGVRVDDIRLDAGASPVPVETGDLLDVPVGIVAHGFVEPTTGEALYRTEPPAAQHPAARPPAPRPRRALDVMTIPYFRWANRARGPMRVWLPAAGAGTTRGQAG